MKPVACVAGSTGKSSDYHPSSRQHNATDSATSFACAPPHRVHEQNEGESSAESNYISSPTHGAELNEKQLRASRKKIKQRASRKKKDIYHKPFKNHLLNISYNEILEDTTLLEDASYSMMHSLAEGFSIVLYTGTHKGLCEGTIHRNDAVRLVLGKEMAMI